MNATKLGLKNASTAMPVVSCVSCVVFMGNVVFSVRFD